MSNLDPALCKWELVKKWDYQDVTMERAFAEGGGLVVGGKLRGHAASGFVLSDLGVPSELVDEMADKFGKTWEVLLFVTSPHPVGAGNFTLAEEVYALWAYKATWPPPMHSSLDYVPDAVLRNARLFKLQCPTEAAPWLQKKKEHSMKPRSSIWVPVIGGFCLVGTWLLARKRKKR